MQSDVNSTCRYYQNGFCKYRGSCRKSHVEEVCEQDGCKENTCSKRHPKECKKFNTYNGCRFKEECAYKHKKESTSSNQGEINKAIAEITVKHEDEIKTLNDEVQAMKINMKSMEDRMQSLMMELKEQNMLEKEVAIIDNVVSGNDTVKDIRDEDTEIMTVNKKKVVDFNCDMCTHKLKTEKSLVKHMNTKHEGYKTCKHCSKCFKNVDTLETHVKTVHNQKKKRNISEELTEEVLAEHVDCGNWICMEETGSCGGFCAYDR